MDSNTCNGDYLGHHVTPKTLKNLNNRHLLLLCDLHHIEYETNWTVAKIPKALQMALEQLSICIAEGSEGKEMWSKDLIEEALIEREKQLKEEKEHQRMQVLEKKLM